MRPLGREPEKAESNGLGFFGGSLVSQMGHCQVRLYFTQFPVLTGTKMY